MEWIQIKYKKETNSNFFNYIDHNTSILTEKSTKNYDRSFISAPMCLKSEKKNEKDFHRGKCVTGVGDEHASLADGAVTDSNAFYKPRRAHLARSQIHHLC